MRTTFLLLVGFVVGVLTMLPFIDWHGQHRQGVSDRTESPVLSLDQRNLVVQALVRHYLTDPGSAITVLAVDPGIAAQCRGEEFTGRLVVTDRLEQSADGLITLDGRSAGTLEIGAIGPVQGLLAADVTFYTGPESMERGSVKVVILDGTVHLIFGRMIHS